MISSTSNQQVKHLLRLQKKSKDRMEEGVFIIEGTRMFSEVPKELLLKVYVSESLYDRKKQELKLEGISLEILSDSVFQYVSDTKTPQGILCIVKQMRYEFDQILENEQAHLLVLDGIQDPGNLGTILRAAEGAGVTGVMMSEDCVDIYNPKTIRSTMGSVFRVPFMYIKEINKFLDELKANDIRTFAAHLEGRNYYDQEDYTRKTAFLIGNEGNGLRPEIAEKADTWVKIPMKGQVESLNVAVATSILIYETCRQRR